MRATDVGVGDEHAEDVQQVLQHGMEQIEEPFQVVQRSLDEMAKKIEFLQQAMDLKEGVNHAHVVQEVLNQKSRPG